ncbi:HisA/HisF-related TIM barrel protein [Xanthobacter sp. V3C-3]|uniref:HisA/HisF-related TIM barrel protein n=1 Tax=Xanthobacter lutulentifluminis TaxID=3119935 RepID=UPI00372BA8E1
MQLIPVIDLKGGCVVHARRGQRDAYRPIHSPLSPTSAPADVVAGLMALAPFRTLYIADLDAIAGSGSHDAAIAALAAAWPAVEFWVDAGEADADRVRRRAAAGPGISVVGTEAVADAVTGARALAAGGAILSLDHDAAGPVGPEALHADATLWPARVIVMTLARVGSGEGPDLAALAHVAARARAAGRTPVLFAAGGVRGPQDLEALAQAGAAGVLVASALHDGRIPPEAAARWV